MKIFIKSLIKSLLAKFDIDIKRAAKGSDLTTKPDLNVYRTYYGEACLEKTCFFNIGAGHFAHPAWTNVDYDSDWYAANRKFLKKGISYDLLSLAPLPIESDSAEIVYSSHTIEHIPNNAAQNMFSESYRILKKKGVLRLVTPNIDLWYRAYVENDRHFFYMMDYYSIPSNYKKWMNKAWRDASTSEIFLNIFATSVSPLTTDGEKERINDVELMKIFSEMKYEDALNYCISRCSIEMQKKYPGYHINWWNPQKIKRMLEMAGFNRVFISGYGQSFSPALRDTKYFDNTHPRYSLFAEAIK
jgi:predicted SAM-dependent methyltransferase